MSTDTNDETTTETGDRHERGAVNILRRVYGSGGVDKVNRYGNNDPLRFLDVLAAKEGYPVRFVQVKTNRFTAKDRRRYRGRVKRFPADVVCEVWVRVDRKGWRIHRFDRDAGEFREVLRMDTCDTDATVEAFRELVGFYDGDGSPFCTCGDPDTENGRTLAKGTPGEKRYCACGGRIRD